VQFGEVKRGDGKQITGRKIFVKDDVMEIAKGTKSRLISRGDLEGNHAGKGKRSLCKGWIHSGLV